jgi:hypothetical protein
MSRPFQLILSSLRNPFILKLFTPLKRKINEGKKNEQDGGM